MPTYDYYSKKTDETREVFHGMNEKLEILDSKGNLMKKVIHGGTGFTIKTGGTRNRTAQDRYGHKKTENMSTPTEAAQAKASEAASKIKEKTSSKDPYEAFRD